MTVVDVDITNWEAEVVDSHTITVVEFWHHRCPWCLQMTPIYDALAQKYDGRMKFTRLNVLENRENQDLAVNLGVRGTPTFIYFCDGRPVGMKVGFQTHEQLTQSIETMLDEHEDCLVKSTKLP